MSHIRFLILSHVLLTISSVSCSFEIFTEDLVTAVRGNDISIPCNFSGNPTAVYWYRHNSTGAPDSLATIVAQDFQGEDIIKGGSRYNITDDHSLVIKNVAVQDETTYSCLVVLDSDDDNRGYTNLKVISLAEPREPIIVSCEITKPGRCTFKLINNPQQITLTCELDDVRPPANLTWRRSDGKEQDADEQRYENNGLHAISSKLQVERYDYDYDYKCEAEGKAVNGTSSMTASFVVDRPKGGLHGGLIALIIIIIVIITLVVVIVVIYYKRNSIPCIAKASSVSDAVDMEEARPINNTQELSEIERLRKVVRDYTPGKLTDRVLNEGFTLPAYIRLAIIGETSAGKSSTIRSIKYAYSGEYSKEIEISDRRIGGAMTLGPTLYKITDSIHIQDNRGMMDFDTEKIDKIMQRLEKDQVSLLIPIVRPENAEHMGEFLEDLSKAIRKKFDSFPIVILTHRDKVTDEDEREILRTKIAYRGGLLDNVKIIFVENFTKKPTDESMCEDLITEFLEVLHSMLVVADSNLVQQLNKRAEVGETNGNTKTSGFMRKLKFLSP